MQADGGDGEGSAARRDKDRGAAMPEGADQPAMQAQLDYGAMTVEQMRQRLVQGISGCEDREVLARLCALLEGSGEGTSVAPLDIEGTAQATETLEGERKSAPRSAKKVDFVCSNPDGCQHCLKNPVPARRAKWKEMAWWRNLLAKTEGPIDQFLTPLGVNISGEQTYKDGGVPSWVGKKKLALLLQETFGGDAGKEQKRFAAQKSDSTCPMLCSNCFHHYSVERQKANPAPVPAPEPAAGGKRKSLTEPTTNPTVTKPANESKRRRRSANWPLTYATTELRDGGGGDWESFLHQFYDCDQPFAVFRSVTTFRSSGRTITHVKCLLVGWFFAGDAEQTHMQFKDHCYTEFKQLDGSSSLKQYLKKFFRANVGCLENVEKQIVATNLPSDQMKAFFEEPKLPQTGLDPTKEAYLDSVSKTNMYEELFAVRSPLQTAQQISSLADDPRGNDSWRHLLSIHMDVKSATPCVLASLPQDEAHTLIFDAREVNRMLWSILLVSMADVPAAEVSYCGIPHLLNSNGQITQRCDNEMIQDIHKGVSSFWLNELEVMTDDCPSFPNDPLGRLQSIVSVHEAWLPNHDMLAVLLIGFRVALFRDATKLAPACEIWPQLYNQNLIEDREARQKFVQSMDSAFSTGELLHNLGYFCLISHEHAFQKLRENPGHADKLLGFLTERFFNTSWFWAHIRSVSLVKHAIQVTYDSSDYEALQDGLNKIHLLQRSPHQTYPSFQALDMGRQSWDAVIVPHSKRTLLASIRAYNRAEDGDYRFYYMYAPPTPDLNGPLFLRRPRELRDARKWSLFDNHLLSGSDETPDRLEWIQTVDFAQHNPNARMRAKTGRSTYDPGRPLFHEIDGGYALCPSDCSTGFVVAVPKHVAINGTDLPTVVPPRGGWRSPVFVSTKKSTVEIFAVFSQVDSLKHHEEKTPVASPEHRLVEIPVFRAKHNVSADHPMTSASTPEAFVESLEALGAEMTKSSVTPGLHTQTYGVSSDRNQKHLLSKFKPFHGFLFAVSHNLIPPCVQGKLEEIKTLHKKGRTVPIRSYLQLEFETVLDAIKKAGHVWWPSNSKHTD